MGIVARCRPLVTSQTTIGRFSKFQTSFDSPLRELCQQGNNYPEVINHVTYMIKVKMFDLWAAVSIYKIGWGGGGEPTGGPPSTGPPDVPIKIP